MKGEGNSFNAAARLVATIFGVLAGLGGIRHGIGEMLQGNVAPEGIFIDSWTEGPLATNMGGEPAMTIVPNLLVTGVLTCIVGLAVMVWAGWHVDRRNGGLVLIALSVAMLLVGGGFGPPIIGILAGVAGLGIRAPIVLWRAHYPINVQRFLAGMWPWVFGVSVVNGIFLFVGSLILVYVFDVDNADLFLSSFYLAVLLFVLLIVTGIAYDIRQDEGRLAV